MARQRNEKEEKIAPEDNGEECPEFGKGYDSKHGDCLTCITHVPRYSKECELRVKGSKEVEKIVSGEKEEIVETEEKEEESKGRIFKEIDPKKVKIKKGWNPRKNFTNIESMMNSIIENGVKVPVTVKDAGKGNYELIDGERRIKAIKQAIKHGNEIGLIPAFIEGELIEDAEALFDVLVCNDGERLEPIEEAQAFKRLKDEGLTSKEISKRIGRSIGHIDQRLMLLKGSSDTQKAVKEKKIPASLASDIIRDSKGDKKKEKKLAKKAEEKKDRKEVRKEVDKKVKERKAVREGKPESHERLQVIFKESLKALHLPVLKKDAKGKVIKLLKDGQNIIKSL